MDDTLQTKRTKQPQLLETQIMHQSVMDFVTKHLTRDDIEGQAVLEVGSRNHNGTVRHYIEDLEPAIYVGVDIQPGPGVDIICDCTQLTTHFPPELEFDIVIATELLEHVKDWRTCITELAAVTIPAGLLLITTRSPHYHYHPNPDDYWRYTLTDMARIAAALPIRILDLTTDPQAPGVFMLATKCATLNDIEVERIEPRNGPSPNCTCQWCQENQ